MRWPGGGLQAGLLASSTPSPHRQRRRLQAWSRWFAGATACACGQWVLSIGYRILGAAGGYPRHSTDWNALVITGGIVKRWGYGEAMPPRILAQLRRQPLGSTLPITGLRQTAKRAVAIPVDWRVRRHFSRNTHVLHLIRPSILFE